MPQETHNIPHTKSKQGIFLHNYFKNLTTNVILPGNMSILRDICYLRKTDPKIIRKYRATRNF